MNSFFSHDSNARNSDKLIPLRMKHGAEGYGVYFMILERLRDEPSYMSVKDYNMIAFDLRVSSGLIRSVIEDFGLFSFTEDGERFYSEGFLKRMSIKDAKSEIRKTAGTKGAEKRWGKTKIPNATENDGNAMAMLPKKIASKEKESKEKETHSLECEKESACDSFFETDFSANSVISHQFSDFWSQYPKQVGENLARNAWFELSTAERVSCLERLPKAREYLLLRGKTYIPMPDKFLREQRWCEDFDALIAEHRARGSPKQFTTESTGANLVRFGNALDVADEDWSEEERERDEFLASRRNA